MAIRSLSDFVNGCGCLLHTSYRKLPTAVSTATSWFDMSMAPGFPIPNYYASNPLEARYMAYSRQKGMYHGHGHYNEKYLYESMIMATGTGQWGNTPMILMDYLLYYPFIDEGSTDKQMMDNTESLPRYQNDKNIQMMAVSLGGRIGGQTMQIKYVNQDGVSGRITPLIMGNNSSNTNGTLMNTSGLLSITGATPFLPLQAGDTGVRSIESVQMISGVDTGIFALVLVKPLVSTPIFDSVVPSYKNTVSDNGCFPIKIEDDAYLNILICSNGGYAGQTLLGYFNFLVK